MGLTALVFWMVVFLFLFPFAYAIVTHFRDKAENRRQLREIKRKLDASKHPKQ